MNKKTHWRSIDSRIESLKIIMSALQKISETLHQRSKDVYWYDAIFLLEDLEPITGIAFISLQNYINSSIYDKYENLDKQYLKYKIGKKFRDSGRTKIELIIATANYAKHRDSPNDLQGETPKILNDFDIKFDKNVDILESPLFKAMDFLSEKWDLLDLLNDVVVWRKELWEG